MRTLILLFALLTVTGAQAKFAPPALTGPVVDAAAVINSKTEAELAKLLGDIKLKGLGQIQVLTIPSLEGMAIEQASIEIVEQWKLGDAKKDDGILFLIAPNERKVRIEVGQGFEGVLTDLDSSRILRRYVLPEFKKRNYNDGIAMGTLAIVQKVAPEFAAGANPQMQVEQKIEGFIDRHINIFIFIIFVAVMLLRMIAGPGHFVRGHRGGFGGFGGGGFGGSSGGGWSGGGGGFSGGGSSDSW